MRTAIVHYWLVSMRGGERVLEQLCKLYPEADVYTHVVDEATLTKELRRHDIETTFISSLPFARRLYQAYLPLMPWALERLDLTSYGLILSSESGPAKGVIPGVNARHVCYCHSPMRYVWDEHYRYVAEAGPMRGLALSFFAHYLRAWDVATAARVDKFVANSRFVAQRVRRYYGRPATVVHPPVDLERFSPSPVADCGPFYLLAGALVGYKRADLAIEAVRGTGRRLVVAGEGPCLDHLRRDAPSEVSFLGRVTDEELTRLYARCRALIFPGQEDFGIVPLEAMASGRPVIALGRGGVLDTVRDGINGLLFADPTPDALRAAMDRFEAMSRAFDPDRVARTVRRFSEARFRQDMRWAIEDEAEEALPFRSVGFPQPAMPAVGSQASIGSVVRAGETASASCAEGRASNASTSRAKRSHVSVSR